MKIEKRSDNPERWEASGEVHHGVSIHTLGDTREEARQNWEATVKQVLDAGAREKQVLDAGARESEQ